MFITHKIAKDMMVSSTGSSNGGGNMFGLTSEQVYIAYVVATYWFVSINMVYLNKALMSSDELSVPAPLFVTWFQCVVTAFICWLAGEIGTSQLKRQQQQQEYDRLALEDGGNGPTKDGSESNEKKETSFWAQFPKAEYLIGSGQKVFPLSIVFVGMITFNNLCLKLVEVSFYNVARSLTIVFNVVLSTTMLGQHNSMSTMYCLAIVIFGFFIGSNGELNFSLYGTLSGVASSLFVSLNSIYTKKVLQYVDNDHWKLTFYNNVNASVLFIPLMIIFEHQALADAMSNRFHSIMFWCAMIVAGIFGFSIGIVTVLQIKATSPLTHNISGTAKAAVQSLMAFYIWGNPWTVQGLAGIFITLGGSLAYTYVKMNESSPPKSKMELVAPSKPVIQDDDVEKNPLLGGTSSKNPMARNVTSQKD